MEIMAVDASETRLSLVLRRVFAQCNGSLCERLVSFLFPFELFNLCAYRMARSCPKDPDSTPCTVYIKDCAS